MTSIILKLDDVGAEGAQTAPAWQETFAFLNDEGVTATLGLSGKDLEHPPEAFLTWLSQQADAGHEIWNHGYAHDRPPEAQPPTGRQGAEFCGMPFAHQLAALNHTQALAHERLDLTLTTFGAPFNATDEKTAVALDAIDELTVWLFKETDCPTTKHVVARIPGANLEFPVHKPDFDAFLTGFNANRQHPLITLQGHPNSWFDDRSRFENFQKIVRHLRDEGAQLVTPRSLV